MPWRTNASATEDEAELPPGRQLLAMSIGPTADAIEEWLEIATNGAVNGADAFAVLSIIGPTEAAILTGRIVLNASVQQMRLTATANAVAKAFIDHVEMTSLRRNARPAFDGMIKSQQMNRTMSSAKRKAIRQTMTEHGVRQDFTLKERIRAGVKAIELFCDATGLFTIESDKRGGRWVRPTNDVHRWLEEQHARCEILTPVHMPMVIPPRRWTSPFRGGYLYRFAGQRLVKQSNRSYHEQLADHDMPDVYAAVNSIQETAWRINQPVLDVLREVWDSGGLLGGLPQRQPLDLPAKPADFSTDLEAKKRWKRMAADVHDENKNNLSKRISVSQRIWVADKFKNEDAIYFPHSLDFRGRIYPIPTGGPNPQGDDIAKALLEFAEGLPIGNESGPAALAVHLANQFGQDKLPTIERIRWVTANTAAILDSADDPLDGQRFWAKADNPYMGLAACIEWAGYCAEGEDFLTRLPVALDGSNSGLQHFSAMLRDEVGGRAVNLVPSDRPQDIYGEVARAVQAAIDDSNDPAAIPWKEGRVTRKIAKRPCMTFTYSATRYGMHDMVYQTLREIDATGEPHLDADNYDSAKYLSHVLYGAISETVNAASSAMTWLREASRVMTAAGLPIRWTTPAGLPVLQTNMNRRKSMINIFFRGRRLQLILKVESPGIDSKRQANSIAPNFIHSMDAAHLMAVANSCREAGISDLAVVHDSFGVHACNAARLRTILCGTFADQYAVDRLAELRDELAAQLPPEMVDRLPKLPPMGALDINLTRHSEYMFG